MKTRVLNILSIALGALMIFGGLNKLFQFVPNPPNLPEAMVKDMAAFNEISWLMPLVAVAELLGGLLIMLPKTRALGVLILFPIMIGILLVNTLVDTSGLIMVVVLSAILGWIMYENRDKYLPLIK
jgi:putative oxidoreductase